MVLNYENAQGLKDTVVTWKAGNLQGLSETETDAKYKYATYKKSHIRAIQNLRGQAHEKVRITICSGQHEPWRLR